MNSDFPVVLDACVLVQASVRDILLRLFEKRLYRARWTDEIMQEVTRTLQTKLNRTKAESDHLVDELRKHFEDAWVDNGYQELIEALTNDPKDRHVLAAAVRVPCEVIVTYNLKHFPDAALAPFGIKALHPDTFLIDLYHLNPEMVVHELHQQGAELRSPRTINQILDSLETCNCTQFAQLVRQKLAL